MITPAIVSYIETERAKNIPDSIIRSNLIANGWSDVDITESMSSIVSPNASKAFVTSADLKEHRKKLMWTTFFVLIGLDILIILGFKLLYGTWGIFGISPLSIVWRIFGIYLISAFSVRGSKPGENATKTVASSIAKIIGSILLAILIFVGLFFAYCLFAFKSSSL